MQTVPIQPVPNQTVGVLLANQACQINVYVTAYGTYFDLYVAGNEVRIGVICQNRNRLVRRAYLGFIGDFMFVDTEGTTDPVYTGLGSRYLLVYLETTDLNGEG